jgi:hypothetical protein
MALPRSLNRLELALPQTLGEPLEREALAALSQHKLNALGVPIAYIDRNQRFTQFFALSTEHLPPAPRFAIW